MGALLLAAALGLGLRRRTPGWLAAGAAVLAAAVAVAVPALTHPGSEGLSGEWAAPAVEGTCRGREALVSPDNTSVDLVTGKTVRLGSVTGGTRFVADDRMIVVSEGRVDSVRLDATARWTWRPARPSAVTPWPPHGETVLRVCPTEQPSSLPGGRRQWPRAAGLGHRRARPGRRHPTPDRPGRLPSALAALSAPGADAGVFVVDPNSRAAHHRPGAVRPSPARRPARRDPRQRRSLCDQSLRHGAAGLDPREPGALPDRASAGVVRGGGRACGCTGRAVDETRAGRRPAGGAGDAPDSRSGLAAAGMVASVRERISLGPNPFRGSGPAWALDITDAANRERVARLLSRERLALLRLEREAVVVREGSSGVRYTLDQA